jgi:hypothetical protein
VRRRGIGTIGIAGAAAALALLFASVAFAHHPEIAAEAVCATDGSGPAINYVATAWSGDGNPASRENPRIDIYVNGVFAESGAFAAPTYSFSGSVPLPGGVGPGDVVEVTAVAVASWGNGGAGGDMRTAFVTVPALDCGFDPVFGRFTGGGSQVRVGDVRVTRGLTIHCDLALSNNLEVNWGGKKFHMTQHLTTVACSDDPAIIQAPPPAPLDTLIGVGTGRYQNKDGFTIEFTLVDYGEPGSNDRMAIKIYETANPANVVLNVPLQKLTGGNLQAHYDQPHK